MIGRPVFLLAALLAASPALAQTIREDPRDIPYFEKRPAEREAVLRQCHRDVRIARSPICQNAERAGAAQLGRPLQPLPPEWRYFPHPAKGPARGT